MKLFLDTEFTDLIPGAKLISIALVDENEDYFYAELTDTYELKDCSDFVKHFVLPFLKGGDYRMTRYECALKIGNWIEAREQPCMLALDAPTWDMPFLNALLEPLWPANLDSKSYHHISILSHVAEDIVFKHNYNIHNALDDALVMKKATTGT